MKTWLWWVLVLGPGLVFGLAMFDRAVDLDGTDAVPPLSAECPEGNATEPIACSASTPETPEGLALFAYLQRIPIPDHPVVSWLMFLSILAGVLTRGVIVPLIRAQKET